MAHPHPLQTLNDADREFVLRMVLASGSLKELALAYGVSYPTIRARLDRVIEHLKAAQAGRPPDAMAQLLADFVEEGQLASAAAQAILQLHRQETKRTKET